MNRFLKWKVKDIKNKRAGKLEMKRFLKWKVKDNENK